MDVTFVVDSSGSICKNDNDGFCDNWHDMMAFIENMVDELQIEKSQSQVGIVVFSNTASPHFYLSNSEADIKTAINTIPYKVNCTNIALYLYLFRMV